MKDQFLYETFIPAIIVVVIALLSAEFVGRSKHIGRGYSFFMMLGLIPGIIGLIFSPSAKKEPTKANLLYSVFGVFLVLAGLYGFYQGIDNFSFINFFALLSYFSSAFYCFELSKGNVLNKEPKYYFEGTNERKDTETKMKLESTVSNLADLKEKGILTNEEYNQKVEKLEVEKAEQDLKNSTEYKQLKSLLDSGVLTKEEFESKIVKINNIINKQLEDKIIDTYNYNVTLINGEILTILNIPKNTNNILGCSVKIHNKNLSGVYISNKYLYEIINDKVVNFYSPKNIKLKDGTICLLYGNFSKPMKGDFIFRTDYSRLNDGKHQLDFFNNIKVKDNRLI